MPKPWPVFEPTPELLAKQLETNEYYKEFPNWNGFPLARVQRKFCSWMHYGLSPFALAAVTKHSPQEVLEQLVMESTRLYISLCRNTQLPIVFYTPYEMLPKPSVAVVCDAYNKQVKLRDEWNKVIPLSDDHLMEALLEKYGGEDWEKHCTLNFNPFGTKTVQSGPENLQQLRRSFTLDQEGYL